MQIILPRTTANSRIKTIVHHIMLLSMLHSSIVAPSQTIITDYINREEPLSYKGSALSEISNTIADSRKDNEVQPTVLQKTKQQQVKTIAGREKRLDNPISSFVADIGHGTIGANKEHPLDDTRDNLFKVMLEDFPAANEKAYLVYELFGVQGSNGVSRSINERMATGGHLVKYQSGWSQQKEEINTEWLRKGENRIMFSIAKGASYQYEIRNLKIVTESVYSILPVLTISDAGSTFIKDNKLYVKGFIRNVSPDTRVTIEGMPLDLKDGEFEGLLELTPTLKKRKFAVIKAVDVSGILGQEIIDFDDKEEADRVYPLENYTDRVAGLISVSAGGTLKADGASITVLDSALTTDREISISRLRNVDIAPMGSGMINVTKGGYGYRFLPDGTKFAKPVPISIAYDERLIPKGYGPQDIKTFYFNTHSKSWVAVKRDTINQSEKMVLSHTDHFTDYINGIIQSPESPEVSANIPTMMGDIKMADPSAEMTLISPPQVSQTGEANVSFPIKIPEGRNGMQPQLTVQYNSEGGNGWMGQGWDISIPAISLDTRWGVPLLDPVNETEIYTLGGEQLMYPKIANAENKTPAVMVDWMPNRHYDGTPTLPMTTPRQRIPGGSVTFTPRKQGSFAKIERKGTTPSDYFWKVTGTDGIVSWYGGYNTAVIQKAVLRQGNSTSGIVHWALCRTEDTYGNIIRYEYANDSIPAQSGINANLNGGRIFHIKNIYYTDHTTNTVAANKGKYQITFNMSTPTVRLDPSISGRLGLKQIEPYFLSNIVVKQSALATKIRQYNFAYGYGKFGRGQLLSIAEVDAADVEFYRHTFSYFNDANFKTMFAAPVSISIPVFTPDFTLGLGSALGASRITATESTEYSWETRPGFGIQFFYVNNDPAAFFTAGLPFGESYTTSKGKITMADMDGDGLDDIVYRNSNSLKYLRHIVNATTNQHLFDADPKTILNINNINKTEGKTKTMAGESYDLAIKKFYGGRKRFKTVEETSIYLTDGNGDNLPDIVNDNKVYFNNGLVSAGNTFDTSSAATPNMVITADITPINPADAPDPEAEINETDYNYDVVRVWQAPREGLISISDNVQFSPLSAESKAVYSIESVSYALNDSNQPYRLYLKEFNSTSTSAVISLGTQTDGTPPLGAGHSLPNYVTKGQKIYFRLNRNAAGKNDILTTNPIITYSVALTADENGRDRNVYNYANDFILSEKQEIAISNSGTIKISWANFTVATLSDDIKYSIIMELADGTTQTIYSKNCPLASATIVGTTTDPSSVNLSNYVIIPDPKGIQLKFTFIVDSPSNVKWKQFEWKPKFEYIPDSPAITAGAIGFIKYPVAKYSIYQEFGINDYILPTTGISYDVMPNITANSELPEPMKLLGSDNGTFRFVVKKNGVVIGRKKVLVIGGVVSFEEGEGNTPITFVHPAISATNNNRITCEYYIEYDKKSLSTFKKFTAAVSWYSVTAVPANGSGNVLVGPHATLWNASATTLKRMQSDVNHSLNEHLGSMHRGWGQFLYNDGFDTDITIPQDGYDKLINKNIVDNQALNNLLGVADILNVNTDSCTGLPKEQVEGCMSSLIQNTLNLPVEGEIDYSNLEDIVDNLFMNINMSSLQQSLGLLPAIAYRYYTSGVETEKWMGSFDSQYSMATKMRAGNMGDSQLGQAFANPTDIASSLLGSSNRGMIAVNKVQRSVALSYTAGYGKLNYSKSKSSYSNTVSDFMDINGDRYPDLLISNNSQRSNMTGGHQVFGNYGLNPVNSTMSANQSISTSWSYIIAGRKDAHEDDEEQDNGNPSHVLGLNLAANLVSNNKEKEMIRDLNGDGLADRIKFNADNYFYQLNLGRGFTDLYENFSELRTATNKPNIIVPNPYLSISFPDLNVLGLPFNLSGGYSTSGGNIETSFEDINGDGLSDLVKFSGATGTVQYNLGNRFSTVLTPLTYPEAQQFNLSGNSQGSSASISGNTSHFHGWPVCCPFPLVGFLPIIWVQTGLTLSGSANLTISESNKEFRDFNGDGFTDCIEKNGTGLKVYYSNLGKSDLLQTVTNPLGGSFGIDYQIQKVDFNNPNTKWAMSSVTVNDGYNKVNDGEDAYVTQYTYENGKYDRRERQFYGYGTVKTSAMSGSTVIRTTVNKFYNASYYLNGLLNESYVLKGSVDTQKYSRTVNSYELRKLNDTNSLLTTTVLPANYDTGGTEGRSTAAVLLVHTNNYVVMPENQSSSIVSQVHITYDTLGRAITYDNIGTTDPADNYTTQITYNALAALVAKNILNVPLTITVNLSSGAIRKRTATANAFGTITGINSYYTASLFTTTAMTYDIYGNLTKVTFPVNATGQAMFNQYTYDAPNFYKCTRIDNAYGNFSQLFYDAVHTDKIDYLLDIAWQALDYTYDSFGRTINMRAANEVAAGIPSTIQFSYYPKFSNLPASVGVTAATFVPVALTKHYDIQHPDDFIETYSFVDGLARPIQVKKDILINSGTALAPVEKEALSCSGKVFYDGLGRAVQQFHPYYKLKSDLTKFLIDEYSSPISQSTVYDAIDRPISSTDPAGNVSEMQYSIEADNFGVMALKTKSIVPQDANQSVVNETYKDIYGKVISTMNQGSTEAIWTRFGYNAIGELLSYTDAGSLSTSYSYDLLGRKLSVTNPDSGLTSFAYDKAGNLSQLQTANLAANTSLAVADRFIKYIYNYNRLAEVKYPDTPSGDNLSNVKYTYGTTGTGTGRITSIGGPTGTQNFEYGIMGEVKSTEIRIVGPNIPTRTFKTSFNYDSWNRLLSMQYPDKENVNYTYDLGGNLTKVTGEVGGQAYDYIKRINYDHFEQRTAVLYGNGIVTNYTYTPELRRLQNLLVKASGSGEVLYNNNYGYDQTGNVLNIDNQAVAGSTGMGGVYHNNYTYDSLNRLKQASGYFTGNSSQGANGNDFNSDYSLDMTYNTTHGIVSKEQVHNKNNNTDLANTYINQYSYHPGTHRVKSIIGEEDSKGFVYDFNGNVITVDTPESDRSMYWDESNRLRVVSENHKMQHYIYNAAGERILKATTSTESVYGNGSLLQPNIVTVQGYTTYPNAFMVVDPQGIYSKHYYAGSERIVSRVGDESVDSFTMSASSTAVAEDLVAEEALQQAQVNDLQSVVAQEQQTQLVFDTYNPEAYTEQQQALEEQAAEDTAAVERAPQISPMYFYHPDHLGSSTFLTDANGSAYQFFLNLPFGETMAEQKSITQDYETPYKFTGKELDEETGLYYFGARYYDPKSSIWLSVDPLAEKSKRFSPYNYCFDNPMRFVDPDGMWPDIIHPTFTDDPNAKPGSTKSAYIGTVENATGNTYQVTASPLINSGNVVFTQVSEGPVTQEQQEFIDTYKSAVNSSAVANVEIVSNDASVTVGDITDNKIDMGDISEFDKAGCGGSSSAGALGHETKEQQLKAEVGGVKGIYPTGAYTMHRDAIKTAEDKINGNRRVENPSTGVNVFYEPDKTKTIQTVTPNGGAIIVSKKNTP